MVLLLAAQSLIPLRNKSLHWIYKGSWARAHGAHEPRLHTRISTHLRFVTEAAKTCKNTAAIVIYSGQAVCLVLRHKCALARVHAYTWAGFTCAFQGCHFQNFKTWHILQVQILQNSGVWCAVFALKGRKTSEEQTDEYIVHTLHNNTWYMINWLNKG